MRVSEHENWCVVMPACDERATAGQVVSRIRASFPRPVIAVDDGSRDGTGRALRGADVTVVRHEERLGYGRAIATGLAAARAAGFEFALTLDADGQHPPEDAPRFRAAMGADADVVSGSRYLPESRVVGPAPPERAEVNATVVEWIREATRWPMTDAFCGMKAYRLAAIDRIALREPGYAAPIEFWARAWRAGLRVREIPVDRIYLDPTRSFRDPALASASARIALYRDVWDRCSNEDAP